MKLIEVNGKAIYGFSFTSLRLAGDFACRCRKPYTVLMGDHPCFWVVSPADAERLFRAGYEHAE